MRKTGEKIFTSATEQDTYLEKHTETKNFYFMYNDTEKPFKMGIKKTVREPSETLIKLSGRKVSADTVSSQFQKRVEVYLYL